MSVYEDELWQMLAGEHGAATLTAGLRPAKRRRPLALAAGGLALILSAAAVALLATPGSDSPAYAVTESSDGTVTLTILEVIGVSEANEKLASLGVPVVVQTIDPACRETGQIDGSAMAGDIVEPEKLADGLSGLRWIIHTGRIPAGDTLGLTSRLDQSGPIAAVAETFGLYRGAAPRCAHGADIESG